MGGSCTILAHVRNSKGEVVESRLFNDLLHYTSNNRELAKEYYAVGTNPRFLEKVSGYENFETDENGEITFKSLKSLAGIDIKKDTLVQVLNDDIGTGVYSYDDAVSKVQEFNTNNLYADEMIATMYSAGEGRYFVSVVPKVQNTTTAEGRSEEVENTSTVQQQLHDTVRDNELVRKMTDLLRRHRVSVEFLENAKTEGRYSTENAIQTEQGLYSLIQVSNGERVTDALAEEAGHFAVGALGDNPLVHRLEDLLKDGANQREALGEEEYDSANLGTNPAREVAGRLVGKALQKQLKSNNPFNTLANRIANVAKRIFATISGNEVRWAVAKAEQIANKIAYGFVEGNTKFSVENAINIKETMLNDSLTLNQRAYRDVMDELGRMCKRLQAIAQDKFTGKMLASQAMSIISGTDVNSGENALQMSEALDLTANSYAFDGIVQALVQVTDYLGEGKEIDSLLTSASVALDNPAEFLQNMANIGKQLRQARVFLRSAEVIIRTINSYAINNKDFVLPNGYTLRDVKYVDDAGNWRSINVEASLRAYASVITQNEQKLTSLESAYFARFCEDMYGSKYITTTVGKLWGENVWKDERKEFVEKKLSIENMVLGEGIDDIDIMHRYIGSMSNNPDIIGQIVDKVVKQANKRADDLTIEYRNRLRVLEKRAKDLGLDINDFIEVDENGVPTGNMVMPPAGQSEHGDQEEDFVYEAYVNELKDSPYDEVPSIDYTTWERDRDAFKKQAWEKFKEDNPTWETMSGFTRGFLWDKFLKHDPTYSMKKWNKEHSICVEVKDNQGNIKYVKWVPNLTYGTDKWEKLREKYRKNSSAYDSLDKWMHDYRTLKQELDSMLPLGSTVSHRLPQFRGTFINAVRNSKGLEEGSFTGLKSFAKTFGRRNILELFVESSMETDYGDMNTMNSPEEELLGTTLNYEEERAARIPLFGINKIKDMRDLSTDIFHSTLAYASMACSYASLNTIVDALEVGKEALYSRHIKGEESLNRGKNRRPRKEKAGSLYRRPSGTYETLERGMKNSAYGRYIKYIERQVYGITATDWGLPIGKGKKILLAKTIQNINSLGGTLFLKGNILGGSVNTATGFFNILKESAVGDDLNLNDWLFANKYYFKYIPQSFMEMGDLVRDDKLSLFLSQMNTSGNNKEEFRSWYTSRSKAVNIYEKLGYLPYSFGDHYMQAMSYLSMAHGINLYDVDGKINSNLWDAYKTTKNTDQFGNYPTGNSLEFSRMCPLGSKEITTDALKNRGVYLKKGVRSQADFDTWLIWEHPEFMDYAYRKNNVSLYNKLKDEYFGMDDEHYLSYKSSMYSTLSSILQKVEEHLKGVATGNLLISVPSFSATEKHYLDMRKLKEGDNANILQSVRDDIYNIIWTKADESAYMDRCREINNRLHGIYNSQDKTAFHQQWYTNAFLAMKGWALGYLEMMYSGNHYSIALGRNVEGFVNTAAKIHINMLSGLFGNNNTLSFWDMVLTMVCPWSKKSMQAMQDAGFSAEQNMNARRMCVSAILMGILYALRLATAPPDKDDEYYNEDELDPTTGLIYYMAMRTLLEQEAFLYAPEIITQSGQLMDLLPVGFSALFDLGKLGYEFIGAQVTGVDNNNFYYPTDDRYGRHQEGDPRYWQHLQRLIPYVKSFWAIEHPYEAAKNYNFGRKLRRR